MLPVKITVLKVQLYKDLMEEYELPNVEKCPLSVNDTFISYDAKRPKDFCKNAWPTLRPFVKKLAMGEGHFYGEWMKDPYSAIISCNDGVRPVSFKLEIYKDEK